jgi:hypothetical protein
LSRVVLGLVEVPERPEVPEPTDEPEVPVDPDPMDEPVSPVEPDDPVDPVALEPVPAPAALPLDWATASPLTAIDVPRAAAMSVRRSFITDSSGVAMKG